MLIRAKMKREDELEKRPWGDKPTIEKKQKTRSNQVK